MKYMTFKISCLILEEEKKLFSSIFTFSKQLFLGIFYFGLKTPKNYKSCSKKAKIINLPNYLSYFIKKIHFSTLTFFLGPVTWNRPNVRSTKTPTVLFTYWVFSFLFLNSRHGKSQEML